MEGIIYKNGKWRDASCEVVHVLFQGPRLGDGQVRLCILRPSYGVCIGVRLFYPWNPPFFLRVVGRRGGEWPNSFICNVVFLVILTCGLRSLMAQIIISKSSPF